MTNKKNNQDENAIPKDFLDYKNALNSINKSEREKTFDDLVVGPCEIHIIGDYSPNKLHIDYASAARKRTIDFRRLKKEREDYLASLTTYQRNTDRVQLLMTDKYVLGFHRMISWGIGDQNMDFGCISVYSGPKQIVDENDPKIELLGTIEFGTGLVFGGNNGQK